MIFSKKTTIFVLAIFLLYTPLFSLQKRGKIAEITVSKTFLKESSNSFSKTLLFLSHGDNVEIIEEKGSWLFVKSKGINGWIIKSSVVKRVSFSNLTGKVENYINVASAATKGNMVKASKEVKKKYDVFTIELLHSTFYKNLKLTNIEQSQSSFIFEKSDNIKSFHKEGKLGEYKN